MSGIFKSGGPFNVEPIGPDRHRLSIPIPADSHGLRGHECPNAACQPTYFKVRPGTGLKGQLEMFCPYCRTAGSSQRFFTEDQRRYGTDQAVAEAKHGLVENIKESLGLDRNGRRKFGGGLISMEMRLKDSPREQVRPPREEPLRRDIVCPHCTCEQAVFGLAVWCTDCGKDVFLVHVAAELQVLRTMLAVVPERRKRLGARVAGRDIEDALENTVSVFEAVLKFVTRRHLLAGGRTPEDADDILRKEVRNAFQSIVRGTAVFKTLVGVDLFGHLSAADLARLTDAFEKRHPIAHNLGVVDKGYLAKALSASREGREIALHSDEVGRALDLSELVIRKTYEELFSPPPLPPPPSAPPGSPPTAPSADSGPT